MASSLRLEELFEGRHFDREIIVLCVRWYLRFKPSFRDLAEMMAERGRSMAHTTIMRPSVSATGTAWRGRAERHGVWTRPP